MFTLKKRGEEAASTLVGSYEKHILFFIYPLYINKKEVQEYFGWQDRES